MHELMGRVHAALLKEERGQGTVEYVGLILLIAVVIGGVVVASHGLGDSSGIASAIVKKLSKAITDTGTTQ